MAYDAAVETAMEDWEHQLRQQGYRTVAGVDEAGRGPLAGPVVAGAIVLPENGDFEGLNDSKKLSEAQRDYFYEKLTESTPNWSVAVVEVGVIDEINILQAARLAMKQAVENLSVCPDMVLVDGNREIAVGMEQKTLVGGDRRCLSIAAASVLAKVTRDRLMQDLHRRFPGYGFDRHKGYGTELHRARIAELGPCLEHRKTFKGVKEYL